MEFDSIPAGPGNGTFYLYYGNPNAAQVSSGANTFIKYDDLEWGSNVDALSTSAGSVTWTTTNAIISTERDMGDTAAYSGTRSAKLPGVNGASQNMIAYFSMASNQAVRFRVYKENAAYAFVGEQGDGDHVVRVDIINPIYYLTDSGQVNTGASITSDAWQLLELSDYNTTNNTFDIWLNGTKIKDNAAMRTAAGYDGIFVFWNVTNTNDRDVWVDDLIIRKWTANEPVITVWGAEATPGGNSAPAVTNEAGASVVTATAARLNGEVTTTGGESPDAHVYWGTADGSLTSSFVYDGDGRRVKKTEGGQTILYVNKYYERNLTTGEVTTYYYMGNRRIAMKKNTDLRYVQQDHLTGTSLMTDDSGAQMGTTMKYLPFGATRTGSVPTDIRFTGQRLDGTGLYYYGGRYYDAEMGRFISADILVQNYTNPQSLNHYSYCFNNPLKYIDPSGMEATGDPDLDFPLINEICALVNSGWAYGDERDLALLGYDVYLDGGKTAFDIGFNYGIYRGDPNIAAKGSLLEGVLNFIGVVTGRQSLDTLVNGQINVRLYDTGRIAMSVFLQQTNYSLCSGIEKVFNKAPILSWTANDSTIMKDAVFTKIPQIGSFLLPQNEGWDNSYYSQWEVSGFPGTGNCSSAQITVNLAYRETYLESWNATGAPLSPSMKAVEIDLKNSTVKYQ